MSAPIDPNVAAQLRLLRAEIAALREPALPDPPRVRHHLHHRSSPGHINRQRRRALILLVFGAVRIVLWTILAALISCGLLHVGGFDWARVLAESIPFVVLISIYANWATDLDAATAAFAALVASDSHAAVVATGVTLIADLDVLKADLVRLAELQPGEEASALAEQIGRKLSAPGDET